MKSTNRCSFLLFQNVHALMRAERYCVENSINYQVHPVPTKYSSECGMCIKVSDAVIVDIIHNLNDLNIRVVNAL